MKKILMTILCAMFFTFGMVFSVNALTIDATYYPATGTQPGTGTGTDPFEPGDSLLYYWGNENDTPSIDAAIAGYLVGSQEIYKSDYVEGNAIGSDSGSFASSYQTTFDPSDEDPVDAYIQFTGGEAIAGATHLLVKDGNATPNWYLFVIDGLWNGEDMISLLNFWAGQGVIGAISHVTIYGNGTQVPEPGMVILLGIGLIGLAFFSRKRLLN